MRGTIKFYPEWHWSIRAAAKIVAPVAAFVFAADAVRILVLDLPSFASPDRGGYPRLVVIFLAMTLFTAGVLFAFGRFAPVEATQDGIVAGVSTWRRGIVKWQDIERVDCWSRWPLCLLEISRRNGSKAYRSILLTDTSQLCSFITRHAGAGNPLARWLSARGKDV
jgi:hypothetical protein